MSSVAAGTSGTQAISKRGQRRGWWLAPGLLFLVSAAATHPPFVGDSPIYAAQIADILNHRESPTHLWESGHVLWRPLGYIAAPVFLRSIPEQAAWTPALKIYWGLALFNVLCGVAGSILIFDLSRRLAGSEIAAGVITLLFVWGDAVLSYSRSAMPYVAGLTALIAGIWWQMAWKRQGKTAVVGTSLLFGGAALLWLPYVMAIPAASCAQYVAGIGETEGRKRWKPALFTLAASGVMVLGGVAAAGVLAGAHSPGEWKSWLTAAGHGMQQNRRALRAIMGMPRLLLELGKDGTYFKRFLFHDVYHPVSLAGLFRYSLGKIALFYMFVASTIWLSWFSGEGRRMLTLLAIAGAPALLAALVVFEPSSPERFLPVLPFLLMSIAAGAGGMHRVKKGGLAWIGVCTFAVLLPILNLPSFTGSDSDFAQQAAAQLKALRARAAQDDAILTVTMDEPLAQVTLNPLDPLNRGGPIRVIWLIAPMRADLADWRSQFARTVESEWSQGRSAWLEKYALADHPMDSLWWTEGDNPAIHWRDIPEFFRKLEVEEDTGGAWGFVRISRSANNEARLLELAAEKH